jgi:hypothetical protein
VGQLVTAGKAHGEATRYARRPSFLEGRDDRWVRVPKCRSARYLHQVASIRRGGGREEATGTRPAESLLVIQGYNRHRAPISRVGHAARSLAVGYDTIIESYDRDKRGTNACSGEGKGGLFEMHFFVQGIARQGKAWVWGRHSSRQDHFLLLTLVYSCLLLATLLWFLYLNSW